MKNSITVLCLFIMLYVLAPQVTYSYEGIWFFDPNGNLTSFQNTNNRVTSFSILNNGNLLIKSANYLFEIIPDKKLNILKTYLVNHDLILLDKFNDDSNLVLEKGKLYLYDNNNRKVKSFEKKDEVILKAIKYNNNLLLMQKKQPNNFSMVDLNGNVIWEKHYDLKSFSVMDDGNILVTKANGNTIDVLDKDGNFLSQHKLPFDVKTSYKLGDKYLFFPTKNENNLILTNSNFIITAVLNGLTSPQKFLLPLPSGFALVGSSNDLKNTTFKQK